MGYFYYYNAIVQKETKAIFLSQRKKVFANVNSYPAYYTILKNYTPVRIILRKLKGIAVQVDINRKCYLDIFAFKKMSSKLLLPLWFDDG